MTYSVGTITLTNGSRTVTGAGTKFVANVLPGFLLIPVGGAAAVIAEVNSDTQLTLARPWVAATMQGTGYDIVETSGGDVDLSLRALAILNTFGAVRDTVGQGMFPDGGVGTPAFRFINDQDTGVTRLGENQLGFIIGAMAAVIVRQSGVAVSGNIDAASAEFPVISVTRVNGSSWYMGGYQAGSNSWNLRLNSLAPYVTVTDAGLFLVGAPNSTSYGGSHRITRSVAEGQNVLSVDSNQPTYSAGFFAVAGAGYNEAKSAVLVGRNTSTGRSINAGGTINAGGADYAEYMVKAAGCGLIAKGDVCGVDRDGRLTKTWADAVSFVVKSTDPSLVGGDTWDADVGPSPDQPNAEPTEPAPPAPPAEGASDEMIAAWRGAMAAYPAQVASYQAARAEWQKATDAYAKALPIWEAAHEKARQCVDRIAFCGQVPVNVDAETLAACEAALADGVAVYLVAVARGAGIGVVAVREQDMTLPQYMRRIGKVWAVRDGRAWIDVQHG